MTGTNNDVYVTNQVCKATQSKQVTYFIVKRPSKAKQANQPNRANQANHHEGREGGRIQNVALKSLD